MGAAETRSLLVIGKQLRTCTGPDLPAHPLANAVLLARGRISEVGSADVLRDRAPEADVLDLPGTTITPGLTDAHVHLTEWAVGRAQPDLSAADSPAAAVALLAGVEPGPGWVRARGWNPHRWAGEEPARQALDDAFGDRPVALQSHDMHALWVNGAALRAAGIDAGRADPDGGRIVRDGAGEPTGLLLERAGELVTQVIPQPSETDVVAAVRAAQPVLHALGITGVHSFPGIALPWPEPRAVLARLHRQGELRLRVLQHLRQELLEQAITLGARSGAGGSWIRTGSLKLFLDGALGSGTAWLREPYEGSDATGVRVLEAGEFRELVQRAAGAGIATAVHAIGDAAVSLALDVLAEPAAAGPLLPHRIEHFQCCPPERLGDAARAGIVCSVQPAHLMTDWPAADRHWGPRRTPTTYAFAALAAAGTVLAFGSDAPVEPVDPRLGLFAAVQRQDLEGRPAGGWHPEQRLDRAAALRGYTTGPALAASAAGETGVLAPGAFADLVAWDRDPLTCAPGELLEMRAVATVVAGEIVHS